MQFAVETIRTQRGIPWDQGAGPVPIWYRAGTSGTKGRVCRFKRAEALYAKGMGLLSIMEKVFLAQDAVMGKQKIRKAFAKSF